MDSSKPAIGHNNTDRIVAVLKGASGAVPFAGGAIAELVGVVIPNQRIDRVEKYLLWLAEELDRRVGTAALEFKDEKIGLVEESILEAARPVSDERRQRIALLVSAGLAVDDAAAARARKLLSLLGELDDYELAILQAHGLRVVGAQWKLRGYDDATSRDRRVQLNQLGALADIRLERVGLVKFRPEMNRVRDRNSPGDYPKYEGSGQIRGRYVITDFGDELLRHCGLAEVRPSPT